ncbi:hypothetical protein N7988_28065 (plasmid) [Bacillus cereus]|uniref:BRcat domain-containing protein n=1 Tax=Bacillus cereus TaxID=1396 RepID=UPI0021CB1B5F|nr:hypothetical protein [Bacillus cereus]MCU7756886.1 hypothetical protein [Bacillus cereus]MDC7752525.1 hypothetical protein [Bacillus cereus]UXP17368.1 hypothetical protein N7988_28065 [Bacillus cereus]
MIKEKITQIKTYLKELSKNQQVAEDLDFYTFLATLIPVPGCQQAALLVNKLVANHNLNLLITELRNGIYQTNTKLSTLESDVEKIQSMAKIVSVVSELDDKVKLIMEQAQQELPSEFVVETDEWSTQTIINQIINADFTSVSATNNSHNRLENVDINSKRTHLRATNHSSNYLQGTSFKDSIGTVSMNGITQQGNIQVTGNSVGFGNGSALIFGNPNEVRGNCPNPRCNKVVVANRIKLQSYSRIQCPHCKGVFNIILD